MDNIEMLEKLKDYLENDEYRFLVSILTHKLPWWLDNPDDLKTLAISRGLAVCQFVQSLGVSDDKEEIDEIYTIFKKAVEDIVPTKEREVKNNENN